MAVSKFKATCLAAMERVRHTGRPLLITKRGVPIAQVVPPPHPSAATSRFGAMAGSARELGDIVGPLDETDWEVLR